MAIKVVNIFSFLLGATILHEYTHYGDSLDGEDYPGEEVNLFEEDAYGHVVDYTNAQVILHKHKAKEKE